MAALSTAILALVRAGQHLVYVRDGYRMTREFVEGTLARFGVASDLAPAGDLGAIERAIRPETRLIVTESPTNPYLSCIDLEKLARSGKTQRVKTLVDATFATPVNCRPAAFGIDLVVHSVDEVPRGAQRRPRRRRVRSRGARVDRARPSRRARERLRSSCGVPGRARDEDAGAPRGEAERERARRGAVPRRSTARGRARLYPGLPSHPDHAVARSR